jgi:quinolinate synthase
LTDDEIRSAKIILWRGHCSVHGRFTIENVNEMRSRVPGVQILVHPECQYEVVSAADVVGSTESIIKTIENAPQGSSWAIGTELNLVKRLAQDNPEKQITFLDKTVCYCSTMNRIDLPHLVWAMESLVRGKVINQIQVPEKIAKAARVALERMLALP